MFYKGSDGGHDSGHDKGHGGGAQLQAEHMLICHQVQNIGKEP